MKKLFAMLVGCCLILPVLAGPVAPPCSACPMEEFPPYPHSGHWIDHDRSGTGFNLAVQGGILMGMYYGYGEDGQSTWWVFSGTLETVDDDPFTDWKLETGMLEMAGGQVLGQPYQPAQPVAESSIELRFSGRGLMHFQVDDGPVYGTTPFSFGSELTQPFDEHSNLALPTFPGLNLHSSSWLVTEYDRQSDSIVDPDNHRAHVLIFSLGFFDVPLAPYETSIKWVTGGSPRYLPVGQLVCDSADALAERFDELDPAPSGDLPMCVIRLQVDSRSQDSWPTQRYYLMAIADLTDRRFRAVAEDGWVLEAFRIGYD